MASAKIWILSDATIEFLDYVYLSFDDKQNTIAVYLDFSKAFDTVNHDKLYDIDAAFYISCFFIVRMESEVSRRDGLSFIWIVGNNMS